MKPRKEKDAGWRGSLAGWLEAAYEAFLEGGVDAVKILPLANRLNLSRTSFYWFFTDREALLEALLKRWREKNTGSLVSQANAYAETDSEAMLNIMDCWLNPSLFDARFEFAVRSWALQSAEVLKEVRKADAMRIDALKKMLMRFGHEELPADVRARTIYLVQIGYISMQSKETIETRMRRIPAYIEVYTGSKPRKGEMERFYARHGFALPY